MIHEGLQHGDLFAPATGSDPHVQATPARRNGNGAGGGVGGFPRPYYQDASVTIYHGDCREVMNTLPEKTFDLLLTDPPYGVNYESSKFGKIVGDDGTLDVIAILRAAQRLTRDNRHLYVFGNFDLSPLPVSKPVELIWDKSVHGGGDVNLPWAPQHERISFAVNMQREAIAARGSDNLLTARIRRGSVLRCQRPNSSGIQSHATEKPVELLRQLIESSSIFGETVFDPFMGSGSTLVAARLEGRKAVGIEVEERYCEIAAKRLSQGELSLEFFGRAGGGGRGGSETSPTEAEPNDASSATAEVRT